MEFVTNIVDRLKDYAKDHGSDPDAVGLTDLNLDHLVEACYRASLVTNEGRYPGFRVQLFRAELPSGVRTNRFIDPIPLNYQNINRISFATYSRNTTMCVIPDGDDFVIWGLLLDSDTNTDMASRLIKKPSELPHLLEIKVDGPGSLIFRRAYTEIFRYEHGEIRSLTHFSRLDIVRDMVSERAERFQKHAIEYLAHNSIFGDPEFDSEIIGTFLLDYLKAVVANISNLGHGGMVILIPGDSCNGLGNSLEVESTMISKVLAESIATTEEYNHLYNIDILEKGRIEMPDLDQSQLDGFRSRARMRMERARLYFVDTINHVTNLSSVDGAVVMNGDLDILHIGAEIRIGDSTPDGKLEWVTIIDVEGKKHPRRVDAKGTRHRSAYRFAMENPDSLVIVVSQDGPVSVVKRSNDSVHVWENVVT